MVSVVKMATVLEEYTTEEQLHVVLFCAHKDSMQGIFIKKYFLFTVGSVCRVKRFTTGSRNVVNFSLMTKRLKNGGAEVDETIVERFLFCGFRRTGKAMGQVYQCWWRVCAEIIFSPASNITFYFYFHL
jgi:hypothetical protein